MAAYLETISIQFTVGVSEMYNGDTVYVLNYNNILQDSISINLDGFELPQTISGRITYTVIYASNSVTITFNQPVFNGQLYQIQAIKINS